MLESESKMLIKLLKILVLSSVTALAACTTVGKDAMQNLQSIPPGKGIALFSTSANQTSVSSSSRLVLVEGSTLKEYDKVIISIDYPFFTSHFADVHGFLISLVLPPGDYYLKPAPGNPYLIVTQAPVYKFTVLPDKISYVGNIHLAHPHLRHSMDFSARDISVFQKNNPSISSIAIERHPLEVGPKFSDFHTKGIIWEAPR